MYWRVQQLLILILTCLAVGCLTKQAGAQFSNHSATNRETRAIATRLTGFSVPFKVDANDPSFVEVQLFLSKDNGKNWQLYDRTETNKKEFSFRSDGDGEYWFALRTLDRNRQLLPDGNIVQPELRVIVDTVTPELEFQAQSDAAGRVVCRWRAEDENIDPTSVKILYQAAVDLGQEAEWIPVDVRLSPVVAGTIYSDQLAWWPQTPARQLNIRFEIADTAGNIASAQRQILVEYVAQMHRDSSTAYPGQQLAITDPAKLPPNVVCKDGVCQIVEPPTAKTENPSVAVRPQSLGDIFGLIRPATTGGRRFSFMQVGSRAEYADPPPPPPDRPSDSRRNSATSENANNEQATDSPSAVNEKPDSIAWESKQERWSAKRQSSEGSTLIENHFQRRDIQPSEPTPTPVKSVATAINADGNPNHQPAQGVPNQTQGESFVKQEGDLVISQSTTVGRGRAWNPSSDTPATFGTDNAQQWKSKSSDATNVTNQKKDQPSTTSDQIAASNPLPAHAVGFNPQTDAQPTISLPAPAIQMPNAQQVTAVTAQTHPLRW